jgi:EAL domain-containing protein (putative c-di-GMP-specific phosphodiesterase class I)
VRIVNFLDESLKVVVQPYDREAQLTLHQLGFRPLEMVPQLLYCKATRSQISDLFRELSQQLSEESQTNSRYIITRSTLDSRHLLIEFLSAQPLSQMTTFVRHEWFLRVLGHRTLFFHYQPIVELCSDRVIAHECLARAFDEKGRQFNGQQLVHAALQMGLTYEFDEVARTTCLDALAELCNAVGSNHHTFFINVLPNAIARDPNAIEQNFQQVLDLGLSPEQIVFELTEVEALEHHPHLPQLIDQIRAWGFGLALDDLGSNVAIDHYCTEFHPDVIKLDQRLVKGCSRHRLKQVMIRSLLTVAHEMGIAVLAEGLEAREDIEFCCDIGIDFGQGFGLGTPEVSPCNHVSLFDPKLLSGAC